MKLKLYISRLKFDMRGREEFRHALLSNSFVLHSDHVQ